MSAEIQPRAKAAGKGALTPADAGSKDSWEVDRYLGRSIWNLSQVEEKDKSEKELLTFCLLFFGSVLRNERSKG